MDDTRVLQVGAAAHDVMVIGLLAVQRVLVNDVDPRRALMHPGRDRLGD